MESHPKFSIPGADGHLPEGASIWRKGLVYTTKSPGILAISRGYRVIAGIKCGRGAWSRQVGFSKLYHRVRRIAANAVAKKTSAETRQFQIPTVSGHTWGSFGPGEGIGTALVLMEVGFQLSSGLEAQVQEEPTEAALLTAGGALPGELALLSPQTADEIYNEFDFTEPGERGPITLSYGERLSSPTLNFEPIVRRAEQMAADYCSILIDLGEAHSNSLKIIRREWFLANNDFATVHIIFER